MGVAAVPEPAEVDDASNASGSGRRPEASRRLAIEILEGSLAGHRVDQVERHVDASHRPRERRLVQAIALDNRCRGRHAVAQPFRPPGQAAQPVAGGLEPRNEQAADIACGAGEQNRETGHGCDLTGLRGRRAEHVRTG